MDEEVLKKKCDVRKVLKSVVKSTVKEADNMVKDNHEQTL